jgi:hypothetical protein
MQNAIQLKRLLPNKSSCELPFSETFHLFLCLKKSKQVEKFPVSDQQIQSTLPLGIQEACSPT